MLERFKVPEELVLLLEFAAKVTGLASVLALAWLLNGLLSGHTAPTPDPLKLQKVTSIVTTTSGIFRIATCVCAVSLALITFSQRDVVFAIGIAGVICVAGLPALTQWQMSRTGPLRAPTPSEAMLLQTFSQTGTFVTAVALIRGGVHFVQSVYDFGESLRFRATVGVQKHATKNSMQARTPTLFSPCWKLPYCRDEVRVICPAWEARKTCWKFGGGCYCDDDLIMRVITAESGSEGTAYMFQALKDMKGPAKRKKPPCEKCYIFLEHQRLKHGMLSPLALPATIGLMVVGYPVYQSVFYAGTALVTRAWSTISYSPNSPGGQPIAWLSTMEQLFAVLTGFLLMVYLTKALEYAIFKLKL